MTAALLAALFGVLQGLRHALEPDHVTAVAAMALRKRSARTTLAYALAWGLGHALVLAAVGALLVAFRTEMPERLTLLFEMAVGLVLMGLGLRGLRGRHALDGGLDARTSHGHEPFGARTHRPLLVGVVHGLAGTGAVTAIAVAGAPGRGEAILALALYALGAVLGMCLLAGAAGPIFARATSGPRLGKWVVGTAAVASIALGVVWLGKSLLALVAL